MTKRTTARIGMVGYVDVLRALINRPSTRHAMSDALGIVRSNMTPILGALHHYRVIHIAGWTKMQARGAAVPVYAFGDEPDAPASGPTNYRPTALSTCLRPELIAFVGLLRLLTDPHSISELSAATGMTMVTVRKVLDRMHELRLAHIACWVPRLARMPGPPTPNYQFGIDKRDATRPRPMSVATKNLRYRTAQRRIRQQHAITLALAAANASVFVHAQSQTEAA